MQIAGELVEIGTREPTRIAPDVRGDIKPYQSMATGEMITSRSQHREHLKKHGLREIGNETEALYKAGQNIPDVAPQQRHELIRSQIDRLTERDLRAAIKREVDHIRWNSRRD